MADSPNFRLLFESVPGAYLILDPALRIVAATDAYLSATGLLREAIVGREIFEVLPAVDGDGDGSAAQALRASLETVRHTAAPHQMDVQKYVLSRDADGSGDLYWKPMNTPVLQEGTVAYIIHEISHVEDRARLEQLEGENEQATNQLSSMRQADRAKDEFIAIISHELRTPMTSILGWTRMLALGGLDETTRSEALDALERSTLAQAKLIEDLLDESRIASGKLRLDLRGLDLRAVVTSAVSMARPAAAAKDIELSCDCGDESLEMFGDPARLQQAIGNLLGNAIKFTPECGRVSVVLEADGITAAIDVTDTGPGIEPELLPHIFERFRQGEADSAERQSGLGLGLSITRHLIEMHGGTVSAASAGEWRGSTFTIRLPLHSTDIVGGGIVGRDGTARARALPRLHGVRVLIVEDEIDNRKVLAAALRHCGADVECAGTAAAAFELAQSWQPGVIVCDVALPDQDGCSFLEQLRAREREKGRATPALALTVLGRSGEQSRITAAGFEVFRQKPIDPVDLAHEVERLARRPLISPAASQ